MVVVVVLVLVVLVIIVERVGGRGIEGKEVSRGWLVGDDGPDRLMVRVITRGGRRFSLWNRFSRVSPPRAHSLTRPFPQQAATTTRTTTAMYGMRFHALLR